MYLSKKLLIQNKVNFAILLFLVLFSTFHFIKPAFAYNENGGYRAFGLGYRNKTVVPVWVVAICLALFSYLFILFLIQ